MDTHSDGHPDTEDALTRTQEMILLVRNSKAAKEVGRAIPPWGLIILAAMAMGVAVACMVQAIGH